MELDVGRQAELIDAIISSTDDLMMRLRGPLNPAQEAQLRVVQESGRQLRTMVHRVSA